MVLHSLRMRLSIALMLVTIFIQPMWADPFPGTQPLTWEGDLAARMVDSVDHFLLNKLEQSIGADPRSGSATSLRLQPTSNRSRLCARDGLTY